MTFPEFALAHSLSEAEQEHLLFLLKKLRDVRQPYTGSPVRKITYKDLLGELRNEAYRLERDAQRLNAPVLFDRAHVFDAACNLVLALLMNSERIEPILRGHRERMGVHRR